MSQPEAKLTSKIRRYLNTLEDSFFWKVRGGPGQHKGVSDLVGVYHGKFVALEVKTPENRTGLTLYQREFLKKVKRAGGKAYVVRSLRDVKRVFT